MVHQTGSEEWIQPHQGSGSTTVGISFPHQEGTIRVHTDAIRSDERPRHLSGTDRHTLQDEEACVWYMDDMHIYGGTTEAKHAALVEKVLQECVKYGLAVNLTKSEFHVHETIFLRYIVTRSQVQMDATKLDTMYTWPVPTKKNAGQAFLCFANY